MKLAEINSQHGTIALITVLVMSVLILAIILTISFSVQGGLKFSAQNTQSSQSYHLTQACAETALIRLKQDINYSGNEVLDIQGSSCQIPPILGSGNEDRTIQVWANYQNQVRKTKIEVAVVNPQVQITSWQEVADF